MAHKLTVLNHYMLLTDVSQFEHATRALTARVDAEGHKGVLSYLFYVNAGGRSARAVIDYADADAWFGHHDIAMGWPEMKAMHEAASLEEVTFLGAVPPEIEGWLAKSMVRTRVLTGNAFVAGFKRG